MRHHQLARGLLATLLLVSSLVACTASLSWTPISASPFGSNWPLTIEEGEVSCTPELEVLFRTGGVVYGVNAAAVMGGYAEIAPIWMREQDGQHRVDLTPILVAGLATC